MFFGRSDTACHRPLPGVERRQAACGKGCQIVEFKLEKGSSIPPHRHPNEQVGMVISGRLLMKIGDDERDLLPGDGYAIAGDVVHSVRVLEDSLVIDIFSPPRDDYRDR